MSTGLLRLSRSRSRRRRWRRAVSTPRYSSRAARGAVLAKPERRIARPHRARREHRLRSGSCRPSRIRRSLPRWRHGLPLRVASRGAGGHRPRCLRCRMSMSMAQPEASPGRKSWCDDPTATESARPTLAARPSHASMRTIGRPHAPARSRTSETAPPPDPGRALRS